MTSMYRALVAEGSAANEKLEVSWTQRQCVVKIEGSGCTICLNSGPAPVVRDGPSKGDTCRELKWMNPLGYHLRTVLKWLAYRDEPLQARCAFSLMLAKFLRCTSFEQIEFKCIAASSSSAGVSTASPGSALDGSLIIQTNEIRFGNSAGDHQLFVEVMGVLFRNTTLYESLLSECNIYRLTECIGSGCKGHDFYNAFAAMILVLITQLLLTTYVIINIVQRIMDEAYLDVHLKQLPLSLAVATLSVMMMKPGMMSAIAMLSNFWGSTTSRSSLVLKQADVLCNIVLPMFLVPAGFLCMVFSKTLMDQVLNSVAFLFIPFLDDELVPLLQFNIADMVEGYVQQKALAEFTALKKIPTVSSSPSDFTHEALEAVQDCPLNGLHYIVLTPGSFLSDLKVELHLRRFTRTPDGQALVCLSQIVDADCLFERIEWHTRGSLWAEKTTANLGRKNAANLGRKNDTQDDPVLMKLWKLGDPNPFEIVCPDYHSNGTTGPPHTVKGIFVIVDFEMSAWIQRLRILAAPSCGAFKVSMQHFSMWEFDSSGVALLDKFA